MLPSRGDLENYEMRERIKKLSFLRILLSGTGAKRAEFKILLGYVFYTLAGTLLLCLPFATFERVGFVDNLFNATSALSTTGLSTNIVGESYTWFGQAVLLSLIQIGGIGFMTLSSYILLASFHHIHPDGKNLLNVTLMRPANFSLAELIRTSIVFSCVCELLGAIALSVLFARAGVDDPVWNAVFHSVSSFSTAGFSLFSNGLEGFKFDAGVNIVISALCYMGAVGFIVALDVWKKVRRRDHRITFTSRVILITTLVLAVFGTATIYLAEPTIADYAPGNRFLVASFQAMSAMTTVGFNSVPIGTFAIPSVMTLLLLMMVGASPSGTGGGLKSTTLSAIYAYLVSRVAGRQAVSLSGNIIPWHRVNAALMTFVLYVVMMFFGTFALSFFENHTLTELFFEAISAISTVGLSRGITPDLTLPGKLTIIVLMLIGRVGIVTFGSIFLHIAIRERQCRESDLAV